MDCRAYKAPFTTTCVNNCLVQNQGSWASFVHLVLQTSPILVSCDLVLLKTLLHASGKHCLLLLMDDVLFLTARLPHIIFHFCTKHLTLTTQACTPAAAAVD